MTAVAPRSAAAPLRAFTVLVGLATLFVFVQFFTSGEFVRAKGPAADGWTAVHGVTAYGVLVPALAAAIVAVLRLRTLAPRLTVIAVLYFVAAVGQWGSGHLITTFGQDGWVPFHVFFSSVVLALGVWATVRAVVLLRA